MSAMIRATAPLSSDFMAALEEVEEQWPVLEWSVAGTPIWPLLRVRWMFAEWARIRSKADVGRSLRLPFLLRRARQTVGGQFATLLASFASDRGFDPEPGRCDLVFLSDGLSYSQVGGQWVERFCDPLISVARSCGVDTALWSPLHDQRHPRRTKTRCVQPFIDRATLGAALDRWRAFPEPVLPAHRQVVKSLERRGFGTASLSCDKVASDAARLVAVARFYRSQLEQARPRLAFIVSYYSLEGFAFVLACRQCRVPVCDLQHGVQGRFHPAYAAWPRPTGPLHDLLPEHFWVWSSRESEVIESWSRGTGHRPIIGGNPWLALWRDGSDWPGVARAIADARALKMRCGSRPVVLVTLQFGLSPQEQLEPLTRLIARGRGRFVFWVRLHPMMLAERDDVRRSLGCSESCILDEPTDLPLQALLPQVDMHLTHSSSSVIEAAQSGIPSLIYSDWGRELFEGQIADGSAIVDNGGADALLVRLTALQSFRLSRTMTPGDPVAALQRLLATSTPPQ